MHFANEQSTLFYINMFFFQKHTLIIKLYISQPYGLKIVCNCQYRLYNINKSAVFIPHITFSFRLESHSLYQVMVSYKRSFISCKSQFQKYSYSQVRWAMVDLKQYIGSMMWLSCLPLGYIKKLQDLGRLSMLKC